MGRDLRLVRAARLLGLPAGEATPEQVTAAISTRPAEFARALLAQAAANDDVTSPAAALDFLEDRLAEFGALAGAAAGAVRAEFALLLHGWE